MPCAPLSRCARSPLPCSLTRALCTTVGQPKPASRTDLLRADHGRETTIADSSDHRRDDHRRTDLTTPTTAARRLVGVPTTIVTVPTADALLGDCLGAERVWAERACGCASVQLSASAAERVCG